VPLTVFPALVASQACCGDTVVMKFEYTMPPFIKLSAPWLKLSRSRSPSKKCPGRVSPVSHRTCSPQMPWWAKLWMVADPLAGHAEVLVDLIQQHRHGRGLPVVAVDHLGPFPGLEHELQGRLGQEREPGRMEVQPVIQAQGLADRCIPDTDSACPWAVATACFKPGPRQVRSYLSPYSHRRRDATRRWHSVSERSLRFPPRFG